MPQEYALPEDPSLREWAQAMEGIGAWAFVFDDAWRLAYVTDAVRWTWGGEIERAEFAIGRGLFGTEGLAASRTWRFGPNTPERMGPMLEAVAA